MIQIIHMLGSLCMVDTNVMQCDIMDEDCVAGHAFKCLECIDWES